jgi:hyperosmotically inducible protein
MKTLLILIIAIGVGLGIYWYHHNPDAGKKVDAAREELSEGMDKTKSKVSEAVSDIDTDQIKDELARTGRVVREKTGEAGARIADATADARITAAIKSKFALDRDLSALSISVNTTQGKVTLAGTVASAELIKRATTLALEVDGANEVVSTLQVKK